MPTPVEHYERAEDLLAQADQASDPLHAQRLAMRAGVHAQLASVVWGADDRILDEVAAGLDAEQVGTVLEVLRELDRWATTAPAVVDLVGVDPTEAAVMREQRDKEAVGKLLGSAREVLDR